MEDDTTKEIAKTTGKAIDMAKDLGGFFSKVVGDACKELGGIVHDRAKYYRYKNLLKIRDRVDAIHQERKLEGKSIPLHASIGIPLLEAASTIEDERLQEMWAYLIANSTDPDFDEKIRKSFVDILSSMDPMDARILDWFSAQGWKNMLREITIEAISKSLSLKENDVKISVNNLDRLRLIDIEVPTVPGHIFISSSDKEARYMINITGWTLLKLCKNT